MALDTIEIEGGIPLKGSIRVSGAKNGALPAMALALLTPKPCVLRLVPDLQDIQSMIHILRFLGGEIDFNHGALSIAFPQIKGVEAPYDFVRKMRASILLLGPLLARQGFARISLPGGCAIGVRPVDLHLKAMAALGAEITLQEGYVEAKGKKLRGADFRFETVTVTGTINAMMAATRAAGKSVFLNCAREPEVVFAGMLLKQMGATIDGLGTSTIEVVGDDKDLAGYDHALIPDRIETGTYMVAAAITGGDLTLENVSMDHLTALVEVMREAGASVDSHGVGGLRVQGRRPIKPVKITTAPYPGFPTDMQAQWMTFMCLASGSSEITETIFENRLMHVPELLRMGAKIKIRGSTCFIDGVESLSGAPVMATDLRASASLVLAGLCAKGTTKVSRIYHLDRGYEKMEQKLAAVGARIRRISSA